MKRLIRFCLIARKVPKKIDKSDIKISKEFRIKKKYELIKDQRIKKMKIDIFGIIEKMIVDANGEPS
jgi:hypothetical protein